MYRSACSSRVSSSSIHLFTKSFTYSLTSLHSGAKEADMMEAFLLTELTEDREVKLQVAARNGDKIVTGA